MTLSEASFGEWLKRQRNAAGLTQKQLAHQVGCAAITLRKIEANERRPSVQIAEQLADIFKIPEKERKQFLEFARGDWTSQPAETKQDSPWQEARSNLPAPVTSLIGRGKEITDIHDYLLREDIRLVTLLGPPGIGKTRLSIEAAREALTDFPDGVYFVPLAPLHNPSLIAPAITQALGYIGTKDHSPEEQLRLGVGGKHILIVLDNCEHLIEDVATLASDLLSACPRLKVIASSREVLRLPGEWLFPVPPLDTPKEGLAVDDIPAYPSLMLFTERARSVSPQFAVTDENLGSILAVCAKLDGLPLAIELIAARIRSMTPQALLEKLNEQFILSANGPRAAPTRQKTLGDAIGWSYNLLSPVEQKLFAYLSVFSGGFTLDMAEAIFTGAFTQESVSDLVLSLFDKSLLQRTSGENKEMRYAMLATIQEFARERLREMGAETKAYNWHLAYFSELAGQARPHLRSTDQAMWLDRLDAEHDNIRAALSWAQASNSIVIGLYLATDLEMFWIYRAYLREPCLALENLLAASPPIDPIQAFARGHLVAGTLQMFLENYAVAHAHAKESERLCLQLGPTYKAGLADARNLVVYTGKEFMGDPVRSRRVHEDNLKLFQEAGERWMVAHTLFNIGSTFRKSEDFTSARQAFEQSLALFRKCGDYFRVAHLNVFLAGVAITEGQHAEARLRLEEVISFRRQVQFNIQMEVDLYMLGLVALREGDYPSAKAWFSECLLFVQQIGVDRQLAECLIYLAGMAGTEKRFERAAKIAGAVEMQIEARQFPLGINDRAELKRLIDILHEELGHANFEAAVAKGRSMTMEQAIAYALEN
jgi:predicted ATPase/DNA-binding XRE family transcriptional regulator